MKINMNIKEYAEMLTNREYDYPQFTKEEIQIAKDNGFVIVYGASDDLMEFEGAIYDEAGCFDGGEVWFNRNGVVNAPATTGDRCIEALWCDANAKDENGNTITWTYKIDIPHETFMIYEDGESYCRGIIFCINDI